MLPPWLRHPWAGGQEEDAFQCMEVSEIHKSECPSSMNQLLQRKCIFNQIKSIVFCFL